MATNEPHDREAIPYGASVGLRKVVEAEISLTDLAVAPTDHDRKYVVDQHGLVYALEDGTLRDEPFLDVRDRVVELYYGHDERGLLGLAFHPAYADNGRLFVRYSAPARDGTPDDWNHTEVLAEFRATDDRERVDPDTERTILEIPHPGAHHNGGDLAFGPDGYLYVGMGDGGNTGAVGQGLLWASQIDGIARQGIARSVLDYLVYDLWDDDAGTFASGRDDRTYTVTPRHAGDVAGGLNAADALLDLEGVKERFATHFDNTFNRGRLQRATRWQAYRPEGEHPLPLEGDAGGEYGQAAVYNAEIQYDVDADTWTVTDDSFDTAAAMYLSNQDIWGSVWGGSEYPGRGVPGQSDQLARWEAERERGYEPPSGD